MLLEEWKFLSLEDKERQNKDETKKQYIKCW
jgi:hypothetical protein